MAGMNKMWRPIGRHSAKGGAKQRAGAREGLEGLGAECNGARSEATPGKPDRRRHTRHCYPTRLTATAAGGRAPKKGTKDNLNIVLLKSERCFPARIALDI